MQRLQGLRGTYGIAAPAPLCTDPNEAAAADQLLCQVLEAPESSSERLVPDVAPLFSSRSSAAVRAMAAASGNEEIRLTYAELTALIADAVRNLR